MAGGLTTKAQRERAERTGNRTLPLPIEPTDAMPGTPEKLAVMAIRAEAGYQVFHPLDARDDDADSGWDAARSLYAIGDAWPRQTTRD